MPSCCRLQSGPRLIYALETFLFTLPAQRSALLYVSKLDTTGYAPRSFSLDSALAALPAAAATASSSGQSQSQQEKQREKDLLRSCLAEVLLEQSAKASGSSSSEGGSSTTTLVQLLTQSFLSYIASFQHWQTAPASSPSSSGSAISHLSLHILARAQHAYLFPSSPDSGSKHILTDRNLIKWWRAVVSAVVVQARQAPSGAVAGGAAEAKVEPFYLIPGYNALESAELLPIPPAVPAPASATTATPSTLQAAGWRYGHPYASPWHPTSNPTGHRLPLHHPGAASASLAASTGRASIATLIPHFEDDPKARFLDELVGESHEMANVARAAASARAAAAAAASAAATPAPASEEPASKRQKTDDAQADAAEKTTQLTATTAAPAPSAVPLTASSRTAMQERAALDAVSAQEYWERMGFRQECCSGNAVGVFTVLFDRPAPSDGDGAEPRGPAPPPSGWRAYPGSIPQRTLDELILKQLIVDDNNWGDRAQAVLLTRRFHSTAAKLVARKGFGVPPSFAADAQPQENAPELPGRGLLYDDVKLHAVSDEAVAEASKRFLERRSGAAAAALQAAPAVNTLSVKRKKKAT